MWDERFSAICDRHPDLVAVYESSRGRLGLLLRQTLVPLDAERVEWLTETRMAARGVIAELRAGGFGGGAIVLQWLPIRDVARIVARWVRRWDGDPARRSRLLSVVERRLIDERFLASRRRHAAFVPVEVAPVSSLSSISPGPSPDGPRPGDAGLDQAGLDALKAWYEAMAPCWLAIQPVRRRRLVLQTHLWIADRVLTDPHGDPSAALDELGGAGALAVALQRLVPPGEARGWRGWIDAVRADLARALTAPPAPRTLAWARGLFLIPYGAPAPPDVRHRPPAPAVAWTEGPWRAKMQA
jgi:hypothetical protein